MNSSTVDRFRLLQRRELARERRRSRINAGDVWRVPPFGQAAIPFTSPRRGPPE